MSTRNASALIIGHRGASASAPENTLAAFARAFAEGADGIELDVRLTRDRVPVIIHDRTLRHVAGTRAAVANLTSQRLAEIDVGSWFNRKQPSLARLQYSRQTLPTLDEVFRLLRNQSRKDFVAYVEMKTSRSRRRNVALAESVIASIKSHELERHAVVIGFNLSTVAKVKKLDSSIRTGCLFGPRQRAVRSVRRMIDATVNCGAAEILFHRLLATPRALAQARAKGLLPVVWTVDDRRWVAKHPGLHAVITNNPAEMMPDRFRTQY